MEHFTTFRCCLTICFILPLISSLAEAQTASNGYEIRNTGTAEMHIDVQAIVSDLDIDQDGFGEFVVFAKDGSQGIVLFESTADDTYVRRSTLPLPVADPYDTGTENRGLAVGNLDGDDDVEILVATGSSDLYVFVIDVEVSSLALNLHPSAQPPDPAGNPSGAGILGDTDGDGKPEFVIGNLASDDNIQVYEWNDAGWAIVAQGNHENGVSSLKVGDVDGDNSPEIVVLADADTSARSLGIYSFVGSAVVNDGTIGNNTSHGTTTSSILTIGDLDIDGDMEIVTFDSDLDQIDVFEHTSGTNYTRDATSGVYTYSGYDPEALCIGDSDGDDQGEIWFSGSNSEGVVMYIEHDGISGSFTATNFAAPVIVFSGLGSGDEVNGIAFSRPIPYAGDTLMDGDEFTDVVLVTDPFISGPEAYVIESTTQIPVELMAFTVR